MKHFLINESDETIQVFEQFNRDLITKGIIQYLTENPSGQVTHEKELVGRDKVKYVGNEILNFYCNHIGNPCLLIVKGNKEFFKQLKLV